MQSILFSAHRRIKEGRLGLEMSKSVRQAKEAYLGLAWSSNCAPSKGGALESRVEPSQGPGAFVESRLEHVYLSSQRGTLWSPESSRRSASRQ